MAYIGNQPTDTFVSIDSQSLTGDGTVGPYTLNNAVTNSESVEVFVNFVRQRPGVAYTASGNALTMTGVVASSDNFYVVYQGKSVGTISPPDGSVSTAKIADAAVTSAKLDTNIAVSGNLDVASIRATNGTAAMTIDSSGRVLQPAKPAFNAYRSAGDITEVSLIVWDQVTLNIGNCYNSTDGKFTAPIDGTYFFSWFASKTATGFTNFGTRLYLNGSGSANVWSYADGLSTNNFSEQGVSTLLSLSANDYVQIYVQHGVMKASGNSHNNFSGYLVG